ncbi:unnamed protein product, partial [Mesorhabditis belari]
MSEDQRETTPTTALIISECDPDAEKEQKDPFPEIFQKDIDKYERLMEALAHIRKEALLAYHANKGQKRRLRQHLSQAKLFISEYRKELQPSSMPIKEKRVRKEETKDSMLPKDVL